MPTDNPSAAPSDQTPPENSPQPPEACQQQPPKKRKVSWAIGEILGVAGAVALAGVVIIGTSRSLPGATRSSRLKFQQSRAEKQEAMQLAASQPAVKEVLSDAQPAVSKEAP